MIMGEGVMPLSMEVLMPVGSYDPDYEDSPVGLDQRRPANTNLQRRALAACGRKYFIDRLVKRNFIELEQQAVGSREESIMFQAWMIHNIEFCEKKNKVRMTIPFSNLMRMLSNEDKRGEWILGNRDRVYKERKESLSSVRTGFFQARDKDDE